MYVPSVSEMQSKDIYEIASQVHEKQTSTLTEVIYEVAKRNELKRIVAASWSCSIKEAAERLPV